MVVRLPVTTRGESTRLLVFMTLVRLYSPLVLALETRSSPTELRVHPY